jgi:hypothetical protein
MELMKNGVLVVSMLKIQGVQKSFDGLRPLFCVEAGYRPPREIWEGWCRHRASREKGRPGDCDSSCSFLSIQSFNK